MLEELKEKVFHANLELVKAWISHLYLGKCFCHRP